MKVLIAGYNDISKNLIKEISSFADIVLLEKEEKKEFLEKENLEKIDIILGDISNIETLKKIISYSFNTLVACFEEDRTNYSLCKFLLNHIPNKISLLNNEINERLYKDIRENIHLVYKGRVLSKYIKNLISFEKKEALGVGIGGDIIEITVPPNSILVNQKISNFHSSKWRIGAIYRNNKIILPKFSTKILSGDKLLIIGEPKTLENIVTLFLKNEPQFPLSYGYAQVFVVDKKNIKDKVLEEVLFLYSKTKVRELDIFLENLELNKEFLEEKIKNIKINKLLSFKFINSLEDVDIGFICLEKENSKFKRLSYILNSQSSKAIKLFKKYEVPIFLCSGKNTYKNILCPIFNMEESLKALETSFQLSKMLSCNLTILIVRQIDLNEENLDVSFIKKTIDSYQRMYKIKAKIVQKIGNPIRVTLNQEKDYDLVVVSGNPNKNSNFLNPYPPYLIFLLTNITSLIVPYSS